MLRRKPRCRTPYCNGTTALLAKPDRGSAPGEVFVCTLDGSLRLRIDFRPPPPPQVGGWQRVWRRLGAECDSQPLRHGAAAAAAASGFFFFLTWNFHVTKRKRFLPALTEPRAATSNRAVSGGAARSPAAARAARTGAGAHPTGLPARAPQRSRRPSAASPDVLAGRPAAGTPRVLCLGRRGPPSRNRPCTFGDPRGGGADADSCCLVSGARLAVAG